MKAATWRDLLNTLIDRTTSGKATWTKGDVPGSYVVATKGGSVVLRTTGSPMDSGPQVEVRNASGRVVDTLPNKLGAIGLAISGFTLGDDDEPNSAELTSLNRTASELLRLVKATGVGGESVARRIIDEL